MSELLISDKDIVRIKKGVTEMRVGAPRFKGLQSVKTGQDGSEFQSYVTLKSGFCYHVDDLTRVGKGF